MTATGTRTTVELALLSQRSALLHAVAPLLPGSPRQFVLERARNELSMRYARTTTTLTMAYAAMVMRAAPPRVRGQVCGVRTWIAR